MSEGDNSAETQVFSVLLFSQNNDIILIEL